MTERHTIIHNVSLLRDAEGRSWKRKQPSELLQENHLRRSDRREKRQTERRGHADREKNITTVI